MGIPVRIDYTARASEQRLSLVRALTGITFSSPEQSATQYVAKAWSKDQLASLVTKNVVEIMEDRQLIARASVSPMTLASSGLPAVVATNMLPIIAPTSAASRLFARCRSVSLDGVSAIFFPRVNYDPNAVLPLYIGEGQGFPVFKRSMLGTTLGPVRKIICGTVVSEEMEKAGPEPASDFIGSAIEADINRSLDKFTFDNVAGDAVRPAGLLNGLTSLTPSTGAGIAAISDDVGVLAGAISTAGISTDGMVIVCNDLQAAHLKTLVVGSKFDYEVFSSPMIPVGRVIGIAPSCVVSAYSGTVELEKSTNALVHLEDIDPAEDILKGAPVVSASQCQLIVVRLRCWSAFAKIAPGVSFIDNVTW